ncbi:hypothetical protein HW090_10025 [Pseudomonas sp. ABC1]|uniref:sigma factor-like helix-turn-helix DNA-binding protein n=1 Tax=Pseudomonas sp. ABC1 TaxID=2748080 RepID=UPI0015C2F376|nr:sigma factor-like helix-turn-helix DNA-binding protein [Pseudomonas sp. ABC1]QLF93515.1 hypothetical protein HW090_10025 [Pseudomonas sp. ABC1]
MKTPYAERCTARVALEHALIALPKDMSQVFLLRTRERLSIEQIALSLSIPSSEVERRLVEAMTFIRHLQA